MDKGGLKNFLSDFLLGVNLEMRVRVCLSSETMFNWFFERFNLESEWFLAQRAECPICRRLYRLQVTLIPEWCRASGHWVNQCLECFLLQPRRNDAAVLMEDSLYIKTQDVYRLVIPKDDCLTVDDPHNFPAPLEAFWYKVMHYELTRGGYRCNAAADEASLIHELCQRLVHLFNKMRPKFSQHRQGKEWKEDIRDFVKYAALFLL